MINKKIYQENIPNFSTEKEERQFCGKNDSTKYIDWEKSIVASFRKLMPKFLLKSTKK